MSFLSFLGDDVLWLDVLAGFLTHYICQYLMLVLVSQQYFGQDEHTVANVRIIVVANIADADFLFNVLQRTDVFQHRLYFCRFVLMFLKDYPHQLFSFLWSPFQAITCTMNCFTTSGTTLPSSS